MPTLSASFANRTQLTAQIATAIRKLGTKDIVRVNYNMGEDWTGEPSIFFRIVLTDAASNRERLAGVTRRISDKLFDELRPQENWGLLAYFNFRSKSEQENRHDPEWE